MVNSSTVKKVVVNDVKPQILYIKRKLHKNLVTNKVNGEDSTVSKPTMLTNLKPAQYQKVQDIINGHVDDVKKLYPHTTADQLTYITNQLKTHTVKYLSPVTKG